MRENDRELALAVERAGTRQALEEDTTERVDVGTGVDPAALDLLRRDVVDRAHEASLPGEAAGRGHVSRQTEVANVGVLAGSVVGDNDVSRLHIPVDQPRCVRHIEALGDLPDQIDCAFRLEPAFALKQLAQVRTFDVLHREVKDPVLVT